LHDWPIAFIKDARVRRSLLCLTIIASGFASCLTNASAAGNDSSVTRFVYKNAAGKIESVRVINSYTGKWTHPFTTAPAKRGGAQLDPLLIRAATIAEERANAHSKSRCWHYVKEALVASGAVSSYPRSEYAREAGDELVRSFGFVRLSVRDPYQAPVGSVLVYGSGRSAGHVEIRTATGFASDFRAATPSRRPLIGVYAKISPLAKRRFF
jgi:hypothetical protein